MRFGAEVAAGRPTQHSVSFHRPRFRYRSKSKKKRPDSFLSGLIFISYEDTFLPAC